MYKLIIRLRSQLLVFLTHNMALPFLRFVRKPEAFPHSMQSLSLMVPGTLGNDLFHFLVKKKLKLLPHYAKHDIKHILLEYDTTDEGEACLQCFMLGNGHISFPVAATVLYGYVTMPEYWKKFKTAYRRGQSAPRISEWKWFEITALQTTELKHIINKNTDHEKRMV